MLYQCFEAYVLSLVHRASWTSLLNTDQVPLYRWNGRGILITWFLKCNNFLNIFVIIKLVIRFLTIHYGKLSILWCWHLRKSVKTDVRMLSALTLKVYCIRWSATKYQKIQTYQRLTVPTLMTLTVFYISILVWVQRKSNIIKKRAEALYPVNHTDQFIKAS